MVNVFFFNDTATTEIYTLSLHDALPICVGRPPDHAGKLGSAEQVAAYNRWLQDPAIVAAAWPSFLQERQGAEDRKSTRLNSSHANISYAVFCLKKKKHPLQQLPLPPISP